MSDKHGKRGGVWLGGTFGVLLLLAVYVSGYFVLGTHRRISPEIGDVQFDSNIARKAYYPLGWIESKVRNEPVMLWTRGEQGKPGTEETDHFGF